MKLNRLNTSKKEGHVSLFDHLTPKKDVWKIYNDN